MANVFYLKKIFNMSLYISIFCLCPLITYGSTLIHKNCKILFSKINITQEYFEINQAELSKLESFFNSEAKNILKEKGFIVINIEEKLNTDNSFFIKMGKENKIINVTSFKNYNNETDEPFWKNIEMNNANKVKNILRENDTNLIFNHKWSVWPYLEGIFNPYEALYAFNIVNSDGENVIDDYRGIYGNEGESAVMGFYQSSKFAESGGGSEIIKNNKLLNIHRYYHSNVFAFRTLMTPFLFNVLPTCKVIEN